MERERDEVIGGGKRVVKEERRERRERGRKNALHHASPLDRPLSVMVRLDQLSPSHRLRMNDGRPETVRRTVTAAHAGPMNDDCYTFDVNALRGRPSDHRR